MALPPFLSTSAPTWDASIDDDVTMPFLPLTGVLPAAADMLVLSKKIVPRAQTARTRIPEICTAKIPSIGGLAFLRPMFHCTPAFFNRFLHGPSPQTCI